MESVSAESAPSNMLSRSEQYSTRSLPDGGRDRPGRPDGPARPSSEGDGDSSAHLALTSSNLDKIERRLFSDSPARDDSLSSLESNIKFFKTTIQQLFTNFYNNMSDFEHYRARFYEILAKGREESVLEMEEYIEDLMQHIISSCEVTRDEGEGEGGETEGSNGDAGDGEGATPEDGSFLTKAVFESNASLLPDAPTSTGCLLSRAEPCDRLFASSEDFKKINNKRLELAQYMLGSARDSPPECDIPIKESFAKNDIHEADRPRAPAPRECKSIMTRFCEYICKRVRKSAV